MRDHLRALMHRGHPRVADELAAAAERSKEHTALALEDLAKADVSPKRVSEFGDFLRSVAAIVRALPADAWRQALAAAPPEVVG